MLIFFQFLSLLLVLSHYNEFLTILANEEVFTNIAILLQSMLKQLHNVCNPFRLVFLQNFNSPEIIMLNFFF
jgi:hypothetical protein